MRLRPLLPLVFASTVLLSACSDQRASFEVNAMQSLTAIVFRNVPWGPYQLEVVVRSEPKCQRRYPLHKLAALGEPMRVYAYDGNRYAFLTGEAKYVFDLASCEITQFKDVPDLRPEDLMGEFARGDSGKLAFVPKKR